MRSNDTPEPIGYIKSYIPLRTIFTPCIRIWILYTHDTGWRRLIGSPKLQISFHKRATKYRSLLREMTYKDKGSYESSPPCTRKSYIKSLYIIVQKYTGNKVRFYKILHFVYESRLCIRKI